jgi:hypothetical protein
MRNGAEQLDVLRAEARALVQRAEMLFRQGRQFTQRPAEGVWSAAECLDHLLRTTEALLPVIEKTAAQAPAGERLMKAGWVARALAYLMEPPYKQKMPTRKAFEPGEGLDGAAVMEAFRQSQADLDARLAALKGRALDKVKVVSPFDARVRYDAYGGLLLLLAHQRRHVWQAEETLRRMAAAEREAG